MGSIFKKYPDLLKTISYKIITRLFLGTVFVLVWNKLVIGNFSRQMIEMNLFFIGIVLLVMAWFNYLSLDGFKIPNIMIRKKQTLHQNDSEEHKKSPIKNHENKDEIDSHEEKIATLIANITSAIIILIPTILFIY